MAYDIENLKKRVVEKYPWFGGVAAGLSYDVSEKIGKTAGNGKTIFYNPDYLSSLAPDEQIFALAHEICHVAFDHISRSRGKDREVWNRATDAVINQLLKADGLRIPEGYVDFPEAMGMGAEQYYEELLEHKLAIELVEGNMNVPEGSGQAGGEGEKKSAVSDDHSMWDEAEKQEEEEQQEKEEELLKELDKIRELVEEMSQDEGSEGEEESPMDPGEGEGSDEREDDEDEKALVARTVSAPGNTIDPGCRYVPQISPIKPVIDWRMILRDTIRYGVDWTFTFATLEDGLVRPSLEEIPMPETEVVVDTSWSVDETLLRNFLRECANILNWSKLKIGCFDTEFYGFQEIRLPKDIDEVVLKGGGGTDFTTAVSAFTRRVENKVIFTDGEADSPEEPMDALWLVYGDRKIDPPGGRVIYITPEQLEKLEGKRI